MVDLDDYYHLIEMEDQHKKDVPDDDLYAQLAQKERDLILAAELGKALLEKNDELCRRNESLVEDYTLRIDELEQERHALRLRLESLEAEYENTVKELQDDVSQLRQDLHDQQQQLTAGDKDKVNMIRELTHQNERLTDQVQKAAEMEGQLVSEVQGLRTQASMRTSMHDHIDQLEALHAKISELNEKKTDLDKRIVILTEERDSYACTLEESQDRILMLEKQKFDQEQQIRSQGREIYELQEVNHQLQAQIENLSQRSSYSSTGLPTQTLFNELSSVSVDSEKDTTAGTTQRIMMMDMTFEDDIECDDECAQVPLANSTMSSEALHTPRSQLLEELQKEILEVYNQLRKLCAKIRSQPSHRRSSSSVATDNAGGDDHQQTCSSFDDLRPGQLTSVLQELQQLVHTHLYPSKYKESGMATGGDQVDSEEVGKVTLMAEQIHDLHVELSGVRTHVAGLHADLQLREQQLQQKKTEITQLNSKIEEQQQELQKMREERDKLQDQSIGNLTRDDVLEQTRHDRNNAIEMKIQCEKELSQAQGEIMSLNNQLMAAIHQKVMVSQQRDQWQTDMEELIDIQMRKRLHQEKIKEQVEEQLKEHKIKRSGSFFSRVKH